MVQSSSENCILLNVGSPTWAAADRLAPAYRAEAAERARQLAPILAELKSAGLSARRMAGELTARGIATPSGGRWHAQTILRMIDRAGC
jgi:IS5 family transposase